MKSKTKKALGVVAGLMVVAVGVGLLVLCIMNSLPWWATACVGIVVLALLMGGAYLADKHLKQ